MYFLITVYTNKLTKTFCKLKQITVIDLFETAKITFVYIFSFSFKKAKANIFRKILSQDSRFNFRAFGPVESF